MVVIQINVYSPKREKVQYYFETKDVNELIAKAEKKADESIEQKRIAEEEDKKAYELEKGNRIVGHIEKNLEYGTWRILGGEKGRLDKPIFFKALNEMNARFDKAMK